MKKILIFFVTLAVCQLALFGLPQEIMAKAKRTKPKVAIIIDDAGPRSGYYKALFALPEKVTVAIMPATVRAKEIMKRAKQKGFDVIGHIPMEPLNKNIKSAKMLRVSEDTRTIRNNLSFYLKALPGLKGINNHMGSKVSVDEKALKAIMQELKKRKLFMVDSRTNSKSIIPQVAKKYKVPCLKSDIFLDGSKDPKEIEEKLHRLITLAKKRGYAIGIGHIHRKNLLATLNKIMKEYRGQVRFVGVSELFSSKKIMRQAGAEYRKKTVEQKPKDNLNLQPSEHHGDELEDIFF